MKVVVFVEMTSIALGQVINDFLALKKEVIDIKYSISQNYNEKYLGEVDITYSALIIYKD